MKKKQKKQFTIKLNILREVQDLEGDTLLLLQDRITERLGQGSFGQTFYALYYDLQAAYADKAERVMVRELEGRNSFRRPFGLQCSGTYNIGCRRFDLKTFNTILKAANIYVETE